MEVRIDKVEIAAKELPEFPPELVERVQREMATRLESLCQLECLRAGIWPYSGPSSYIDVAEFWKQRERRGGIFAANIT